MKKLIIIAAMCSCVFGAEPLDKIYDRYKLGETIQNYKKADESMSILKRQEWDALPADIKDQWANYGQYRSWAVAQINAQKQAIRNQFATDRARLASSSMYNAEEKTQYDAEILAASNSIVDQSGAK